MKLAYSIAAVLLALCLVATHQRNEVWRSEIRLWQDVLTKSPFKPRPRINLALAYHKDGEQRFNSHVQPDGSVPVSDFNYRTDRDREAIREFNNVLLLTSGKTDSDSLMGRRLAIVNSAAIYVRYEQWANVEILINQEILENQTTTGTAVLVPALLDLSIAYMNTGRAEKALTMLQWIESNFNDGMMPGGIGRIHGAKGAAYQVLKQCDSANKEYAEAERLDPYLPHSHCP